MLASTQWSDCFLLGDPCAAGRYNQAPAQAPPAYDRRGYSERVEGKRRDKGLFTGGLFAYSRHVNHFSEILLQICMLLAGIECCTTKGALAPSVVAELQLFLQMLNTTARTFFKRPAESRRLRILRSPPWLPEIEPPRT